MAQIKTENTAEIRTHHREMLEHLANGAEAFERLNASDLDERSDEIDGFIRFLERELKPHAMGEEKFLYPALDELMRKYGRPTETMSMDHVALVDKIEGFEATIDEARNATDPRACEEALARARWLFAQIDAILTLHLEKENQILLRLVDQHMSTQEVNDIIEKMHGG